MRKLFKKHKKNIILVLLIFLVSSVIADISMALEDKPDMVSYEEFQKDLVGGKIDTVYYTPSGEYMRYTLHNKKTLKMNVQERSEYEHKKDSEWRMTIYPAYEDFRIDVSKHGALLKLKSFEPSSLTIILNTVSLGVPLLFIFMLFNLIRQQTNIGSQKEEELLQTSNKKFSDVIGHDETIEDIKFIVKLMQDNKLGANVGASVPKGVLFSGDPGTGKTLLAKAIAGEAGVPFIYANASSFMELYVGVGAKRVREIFKVARKHKPCIIFIDEIDAIGQSRNMGFGNSEHRQTINALLQEMDGFKTEEGIFIIGATNMPDHLDKALTRAGRFDREIRINPPRDWKVRKQLFEHYLEAKPIGDDVNLELLSKQTAGFTGADIESVVNEASIICAMRDGQYIVANDIEEAIDKKVFKGNRTKKKEMNLDREIVAYHEAGHAVTSYLLGIDVARASIMGTTSGVGGAVFQQDSESQFLSDRDFLNKIKVCYGGRASESIKFGQVTTGASNDITQATNLIRCYVQRYGFDEEFGLLDVGVLEKYVDTDAILSKFSNLSKRLYSETVALLKDNYYLVEVLSEKLLDLETISGDSITEILNLAKENHKPIEEV